MTALTKCFKNKTVEIALHIYKTVKIPIGQIAHLINFDPNSELAVPICVYQIYRDVWRCLYSNKHEPLFIISFSNNFTYSFKPNDLWSLFLPSNPPLVMVCKNLKHLHSNCQNNFPNYSLNENQKITQSTPTSIVAPLWIWYVGFLLY